MRFRVPSSKCFFLSIRVFSSISNTFTFEDKMLIICKDKTLEWAKHVVEAIQPSLVDHQGYDAKGPKDLPPAKIFGIWLP